MRIEPDGFLSRVYVCFLWAGNLGGKKLNKSEGRPDFFIGAPLTFPDGD
jgi:hypothetical protein